MSLVARLTLAFFCILFAAMLAAWASDAERRSLIDWIPAGLCSVIALMCFVKGRLFHFLGGMLAASVLAAGLWYLLSLLTDGLHNLTAESILGALGFFGATGWAAGSYLLRTRFGFVVPPKRMLEQLSVEFDHVHVRVVETQDASGDWNQQFAWEDIIRVCFVDGGVDDSDSLFFTLRGQEKPRVIPTEASGGPELFGAVVDRGLFPEDVWRKAISETSGRTHCWPPHDEAAAMH